MNKTQKGFGHLVVIIAVLVIAAVAGSGYLVYKNHNKKTASSTAATTSPTKASPESTSAATQAKAPSYISEGPGPTWNTYTNNALGFSIQIPKLMYSGYAQNCTSVSYVYDRFGNKVSSSAHYSPTGGTVPATVIQDDTNFYIVEQYTYQLTNTHDDGNGHTLADSCTKVVTTADTIKQRRSLGYSYMMIPFAVSKATNENDIANWAVNYFSDKTIKVDTIQDNSSGKWKDVRLTCSESGGPCLNFKYYLRYYSGQNKLMYISLGQAAHLTSDNDATEIYDNDVVDSFKLL